MDTCRIDTFVRSKNKGQRKRGIFVRRLSSDRMKGPVENNRSVRWPFGFPIRFDKKSHWPSGPAPGQNYAQANELYGHFRLDGRNNPPLTRQKWTTAVFDPGRDEFAGPRDGNPFPYYKPHREGEKTRIGSTQRQI